MDANEYALKVQPAAKCLSVAIRKAHWMGKGAKPNERAALRDLSRMPIPTVSDDGG